MGRQLTSIERLDLEVKGLRLAVDLMLDGGKTAEQIQAALLEKFGVSVPDRTIANYTERRYRPRKEQWEETLREKSATLEAIKSYGADAYTEAVVMEQLDEAYRRGERATMKDLLREARERERLTLDKEALEVEKQRVENEKRKLEIDLQKAQKQIDQVKGVIGGVESSEKVSPAEVRRRIRDIFGLADEDTKADGAETHRPAGSAQ
jgi:hypothetical protein